ncbi:MarR family winged helix-turn-helix transcriptional regulator [Streptomyces canus]|uniref:MarR family winged helix-turn-helix transcriptional regulator n=1 Tax=Streptomyces canus TaxID=58343 RepID=UPI00035FF62B|nr:MarR family winged helix-turn-helix transcriptional regulator [Streptomyces canus]
MKGITMTAVTLQDVGLAVKRLQWHHHRAANTGLGELGLSLPQRDVLRHLHAQPDASLHALAVLTFQTDQSIGTLAGRMIGRGLIERVSGPGRAVRHRLTAEGERLRLEGAKVVEGVMRHSLGTLTPDELATLHRLLLKADPGDPA